MYIPRSLILVPIVVLFMILPDWKVQIILYWTYNILRWFFWTIIIYIIIEIYLGDMTITLTLT